MSLVTGEGLPLKQALDFMKELSTEEMNLVRGGAHRAQNQVNQFSLGNVALALNISVLSGSPGQNAEAIAGTQSLKFLGL